MADESVVGEARVDIIANLEGLRADLKKVKEELAEIKKAGSGLAAKLTAVFTGISAFFNTFTAIFKIITGILSALGKLAGFIVDVVVAAFRLLWKVVSSVFGAIKAGIETAIAGFQKFADFVETAIHTSADFRHEMQFVGAITKTLGTKDFDRLGEAALNLGKKTEFMASQAAQAMQNLARAGLSADEIIDNTSVVLDMATGNMIELADAASIIVKTTNAMGFAVSDFNMIADHLSQAASIADTDVQLMADAFSNAGGAGRAAGASLTSVSSAILGLAAAGKTGFIAGSLMNQMMMRFVHKDATAGFDKLGMSVFDAAGNLKDFHIIIRDFNAATAQMTSEQKLQVATQALGQDTAKGFLMLAGQGAAAIKAYHEEVEKANGRNKQMATDLRSTVKTAFDILGSSAEALQIRVGDVFAPFTKKALTIVTRALDKVTDWVVTHTPWIQEQLEKFFNWIAPAVRNVVQAVAGTIHFFWDDLAGGFQRIRNFFAMGIGPDGWLSDALGLSGLTGNEGVLRSFFHVMLSLFDTLKNAWSVMIAHMENTVAQLLHTIGYGARLTAMEAAGSHLQGGTLDLRPLDEFESRRQKWVERAATVLKPRGHDQTLAEMEAHFGKGVHPQANLLRNMLESAAHDPTMSDSELMRRFGFKVFGDQGHRLMPEELEVDSLLPAIQHIMESRGFWGQPISEVIKAITSLDENYTETLRDRDRDQRRLESRARANLTGATLTPEQLEAQREAVTTFLDSLMGELESSDKAGKAWADWVAGLWEDAPTVDPRQMGPPAPSDWHPPLLAPWQQQGPPSPPPSPGPPPSPALVMAGTISTVFGAMRVSFDRQVALLTQIAKNTKQTATQTTQPATAGHGHGPNPLG